MDKSMRFRAGQSAPAEARSAVSNAVAPWASADRVDVAVLLTSELVTNSVRHAGLGKDAWVELDLSLTQERLRVEVRDEGPGFAHPLTSIQADRAEPESGWGLYLVERLSDSWGVEGIAPTRVWFELDASGSDRTGGRSFDGRS
jgi:anti-sigma regulatory factor (Ser/Thr protein kinase)